jgi:general secretion pathway protein C
MKGSAKRMGAWVIMAINAALVGGSCFLVANVVTQIAGEAIEPDALDPASSQIEDLPADGSSAASPSMILDRNLFGAQLAGEAQVTEVLDEPLTETKLPLRLLGTAAATSDALSRAAIEDEKTRKHVVVAVGDYLEGHRQVRVEAIERTRVILDNSGRAEELRLFEDQPRPPARRAAVKPRATGRQGAARNPRVRDRLNALAGQDGEGIAKLLKQARMSPEYDPSGDGSVLGMKVDAIKQGSVFESAGLQNGDVITEINGVVIDRAEATPAVLEELMNAQTIEIAAKRGGTSIELSADAGDLMEQP